MIKTIIATTFILISSILHANDETKIYSRYNIIYYEGTLSQSGNDAVKKIYNDSKRKPNLLLINSDGGDILLGMELGRWVYENRLDVQVNNECFSSCANYVFPAGNNKYIGKHALIGFHGGASSESFNNTLESEVNEMYSHLPKEEKDKKVQLMLEEMKQYLTTAKQKEKEFYSLIDVQQRITTFGDQEKYQKYNNDYVGWYYNPEDFAFFGVTKIMVLSPPWELKQYSENQKVFLVNTKSE